MTTFPAKRSLANLPKKVGAYLAPSILAADFTRLGEQVAAAEQAGAELLHIDIMDGHLVPNLSMGPCIVEALRPVSNLVFDVHLMISEPERYLEAFAAAGADVLTVHVESRGNLSAILDKIHELGCNAGITLRPGTPVESLVPFLPQVELALVMTVEPGFGGQSFMPGQLSKVRALHDWSETHGGRLLVEVDGGVNPATASAVVEAGADILVAGSSVFNKKVSVREAVTRLRQSVLEK
ncbi:MAG: ribulose-phosphate 3-epimerase [Victivallales bacterium]|nr:ribulose-phosphate 3-epimerase [Victivallales bacterium]